MIECGEIYYALFDLRYTELFGNQNETVEGAASKKIKKKLEEMNKFGQAANYKYQEIYDFFQSSDYLQEANNKDYIQSVVNIKFNMAKVVFFC